MQKGIILSERECDNIFSGLKDFLFVFKGKLAIKLNLDYLIKYKDEDLNFLFKRNFYKKKESLYRLFILQIFMNFSIN